MPELPPADITEAPLIHNGAKTFLPLYVSLEGVSNLQFSGSLSVSTGAMGTVGDLDVMGVINIINNLPTDNDRLEALTQLVGEDAAKTLVGEDGSGKIDYTNGVDDEARAFVSAWMDNVADKNPELGLDPKVMMGGLEGMAYDLQFDQAIADKDAASLKALIDGGYLDIRPQAILEFQLQHVIESGDVDLIKVLIESDNASKVIANSLVVELKDNIISLNNPEIDIALLNRSNAIPLELEDITAMLKTGNDDVVAAAIGNLLENRDLFLENAQDQKYEATWREIETWVNNHDGFHYTSSQSHEDLLNDLGIIQSEFNISSGVNSVSERDKGTITLK